MSKGGMDRPSVVFILSVSSEIGERLALHHLAQGARVVGTYRQELPTSLRQQPRFSALQCDVSAPETGPAIKAFLQAENIRWDLFISCVGQLSPIGPFFATDFEAWAHSVEVNGVAQLRALHAAHPFRRERQVNHVVFFAGGGTNNPFRNYSAYCLGKIGLIKMCELLDDENPDLNVFIVGTGWVNTKIHRQTLAAGAQAGVNHAKTQEFVSAGTAGTSHEEIAAMIHWGLQQGRPVAGGRNFSVVHDAWREGGATLADQLREDAGKFKLRRQGNA